MYRTKVIESRCCRRRQAYLDALNRRRLDRQLADATRAEQLRLYATQVRDRATGPDDQNLPDRSKPGRTG